MTKYAILQNVVATIYLVLIAFIRVIADLSTVQTARVSQSILAVLMLVSYARMWRLLPDVAQLQQLPPGGSIITIGFIQNWNTLRAICKHYGKTLLCFFGAVAFGYSSAIAFTSVAISFMDYQMEMNAREIITIIFVVLIATLPGARVGQWVTEKTNPKHSWMLNMYIFSATVIIGALVLTGPERKVYLCPFAIVWGVMLGWFHPPIDIFFSLGIPVGQEAEFSGLYSYSNHILSWAPPLIFTVLNEAGVSMSYGLISLITFFVISLILLHLMVPWNEVLEVARKSKVHPIPGVGNNKSETKHNSDHNSLLYEEIEMV